MPGKRLLVGRSWPRWACCLLASFYVILRIGEVLKSQRRHVLTPKDLLSSDPVIYFLVAEPKTRKRGAKVQYSTLSQPDCLGFLCLVWSGLKPDDFLYGGSPSALQSRWDCILRHGIKAEHKLTPGSLRAGGGLAAHKAGLSIPDLCTSSMFKLCPITFKK